MLLNAQSEMMEPQEGHCDQCQRFEMHEILRDSIAQNKLYYVISAQSKLVQKEHATLERHSALEHSSGILEREAVSRTPHSLRIRTIRYIHLTFHLSIAIYALHCKLSP